MKDLGKNKIRRVAQSERSGRVEYDEFWRATRRESLMRSTQSRSSLWLFSTELDFIVNYDIKYDSAQTQMKMRNRHDPQRTDRDDSQGSPAYPQALLAGLGSDAPTEFWPPPVQLLINPRPAFLLLAMPRLHHPEDLRCHHPDARRRPDFIGGFHSVMNGSAWHPASWPPARLLVPPAPS